jgi:hypothetical protein
MEKFILHVQPNTTSTYDDGEILGSVIGRIDIETMKIDFEKIRPHKIEFEGLTLFSKPRTKSVSPL